MSKESTLASESLEAMNGDIIKYDNCIKQALANKVFLARILKATMTEFADTPIDVVEHSIEGEVLISKTRVNPGLTNTPINEKIVGSANEDSVSNEGTVIYDIHTFVRLPNDEMTKIIVNVEAQKDMSTGYDLETRAIFYCARLISSQLGREFTNKQSDKKKYANIKKVYSIWIVMAPHQYQSDSIVHYRLTPEVIYKNAAVDRRNIDHTPYYDLMSAVMVFMPYQAKSKNGENDKANSPTPESGNNLIQMLSTLLGNLNEDERLRKLENNFNINLTTDVRKVVNEMCNLGEGIAERNFNNGRELGIEEGREQGREQGKDRVNKLNALLAAAGRMEDLMNSFTDKALQNKLLKEFEAQLA